MSDTNQAPRKRKSDQPLHVLQLDQALLTIRTVTAVTGMSSATLYRRIAAKQFPEPVRFGLRCSRWRASEIRAFIENAMPLA